MAGSFFLKTSSTQLGLGGSTVAWGIAPLVLHPNNHASVENGALGIAMILAKKRAHGHIGDMKVEVYRWSFEHRVPDLFFY